MEVEDFVNAFDCLAAASKTGVLNNDAYRLLNTLLWDRAREEGLAQEVQDELDGY